jgi:hypothetical protein
MNVYRWHISVQRWNVYGDKVISTTSASILASTRTEVTDKVRFAYGATYDDFRKFWSYDWILKSMEEVQTATLPSPESEEVIA